MEIVEKNTSITSTSIEQIQIQLIMDQIESAIALIDEKDGKTIYGNAALLKITAFTQDELSNLSWKQLIDVEKEKELSFIETKMFPLKRRKREALPVMIRAIRLVKEQPYVLLMIFPKTQFRQQKYEEFEFLEENLGNLLNLATIDDPYEYLNEVAKLLTVIFNTDQTAIYHAVTDFPILKCVAFDGKEQTLPDTIPSSEFSQLETVGLWFQGKPILSDIHKKARENQLSYLANALMGEKEAAFGLIVLGAEDSEPIRNIKIHLSFIARIITATIQQTILVNNLNQQIKSQRNKLTLHSMLFENVHEGIVVLDKELQISKINQTAEVLLGYADREVIGQSIENVLIGAEGFQSAIESALEGIATHNLGKVSLHRRNGQAFPCQIQVIPVSNGDEIEDVLIFIMDISENEQIRLHTQQLEHRAVLGEITAVFAHEVRNPINNISTGLQLMSGKLGEDDPNQDNIQRMLADCTRLNHLMESVLAFSRPAEQKMHNCNLVFLIQRLLDRWHPRMARVKVKPYFQKEDELPDAYIDQRSIEQVFTNLISNAVEAMGETGGTLAIKMSKNLSVPKRPQLEITVSDNGPGIPDEVRDRIFEPFVTTNPRGNGLGLAITKRIVTANRGSITLDTFPGGTVFKVLLPIASGE
ncbi:MAG: PAS domain-containing protein [Anaerolineaceae bacterium]|nr:PAS domain-containing protein [Anaerolineaceae bacterium]